MRRRSEPAPTPGVVPNWLLAGPVGDEPLRAWLDYRRRREQWRREARLSMAEMNRLVAGREPRAGDLVRGR